MALVFLVLFGLVALCGLGYWVVAKRRQNKRLGLFVAIGAVVAFALTWGFGSVFTQDPGQAQLIRSFTGTVSGVSQEPGMHFKKPWEKTVTFNIRNQSVEMFTIKDGSNNVIEQGKDGAELTVPVQGGATAFVSMTTIYSIRPDAVEGVYNEFKDLEGLMNNAIKPQMRAISRDVGPRFTPIKIKERRDIYASDVKAALQDALGPKGVVIDQVNIGSITLDEKTEEAISEVVANQQHVQSAKALFDKAMIDANTLRVTAQGEADADQILRCGADTTLDSTKDINGDGVNDEVLVVTPKSADQCENRLNEQVLTTKWYEALKVASEKGNMIVIAPQDGSAPILSLPAPPQPAPAPTPTPAPAPQPGG